MKKETIIEIVFLAIVLFGSLFFLESCESDDTIRPKTNVLDSLEFQSSCDCGSVLELGTNYTVDSVSGVVLINDYWMQVENHCSQNTRRFSISQDQVITTYLSDTVCFYQRW